MEVTNRTLALLLLTAIVVSVAGTMISLNRLSGSGFTGYVVSNDTGTATVTVQSNTVLRFSVSSIDFGTGYINSTGGYNNCTMYVNGSTTINKVGCINFNSTSNGPFVLENAGTTYLNVTINSSKDASTFIGGTGPLYQYTLYQNELGSCTSGASGGGWAGWTSTVAATNVNICQNLSYADTNDTIAMGIRILIPLDSGAGGSATFLAQGTSY